MVAREFLADYKRIAERIRQVEYQINDIEETLGVKAVNCDSQPHGTGVSRVTENTATKLIELREQKKKLIGKLWNQRLTIEQEIYKMNDATYAEILRRRYIQNEKWEDIANALNVTKRWAITLHGKALKDLEKQLCKS